MGRRRDDLGGTWQGQIGVCLASGPSLTRAQAEAVKHLPCIVANTTYQMAPWASLLFAMDSAWWHVHHKQLSDFKGRKLAGHRNAQTYGAESTLDWHWIPKIPNSGAAAIAIVAHCKPRKIILLGYDGKRDEQGNAHWHGAHPSPLGDAKRMDRWPSSFRLAASHCKNLGVPVVNCSPGTAIDAFPVGDLEREIA